MRVSLARRMLLASAGLALVVVAAFAVLHDAVADLRAASRLAADSHEVIATANRTEKLVLDVETGQRGFLVTNREEFLEPWGRGRRRLPGQTVRLIRLVAGNPSQESLAQAIDAAARDYMTDYSIPLVDRARRDLAAARRTVAAGEGKRRVDAIRAEFARFVTAEQRLARSRSDRARRAAGRALAIALGGLAVSAFLILAYAAYLSRAIVRPVVRVAACADQLAGGNLGARVPVRGKDELARLGRSFNAMGEALEHSRDELESQNIELEHQTSELEDQHQQLAAVNDELRSQRDELERTAAQLEDERARAQRFNELARRLTAQTEVKARAAIVLDTLADLLQADVGVLHGPDGSDDGWRPLATRGLDPTRLHPGMSPRDGIAGRALAEGRPLAADYDGTRLRVPTLAGEAPVRHELHVPLVYGELRPGVLTLGRVSDAGFPPDRVDGVRDLADQAAVALANALAAERVRELATINRAVLDGVRDAIVLAGADGRVLLANAAAERLAEELLEGGTNERAGPELAAAEVERPGREPHGGVESLIESPSERTTVDEFEHPATGRVFLRFATPVRDERGADLGHLTVVREISDERRVDHLKNELLATVSHELRTPLAGILGLAELLVARAGDQELVETYAEPILTHARRLNALVDDLLDLRRLEQGDLAPAAEPFPIDDLLREQVALFAGQSSDHHLELHLPTSSLIVDAERDRIAQVVGNLLSNAIKYSPTGGTVTVHASQRADEVVVAVVDPGLGIPAAEHERVFEKFSRVERPETRGIRGTGLGLPLAREIVRAHGGAMGFESVEGRGSRFWFTLPAAPAPGPGPGPRPGPGPGPHGSVG